MKRAIVYTSLNLILIPIVFVVSILLTYAFTPYQVPLNFSTVYDCPKGMGLLQLTYDLRRHGFITHPRLFILLAKIQGDTTRLQAGEYDFGRESSPHEILKKMRRGDVVIHWITLVEGWTTQQMLDAMAHDPSIKSTMMNVSQLHEYFALPYPSAEGWFFPSTYQFVKGTPDTALFARAHSKMKKTLEHEWNNKDPSVPFKNAYQALIAASLIEKETAIDKEHYLIASVLVNRLKKHMLLQFDPSVLYGTGRNKGPITKEDLRAKSPYNTYLFPGLPPTPIATPGQPAIHAALHPAATDYYYFVADGTGGHYFSATLQEHLLAVKRYRAEELE